MRKKEIQDKLNEAIKILNDCHTRLYIGARYTSNQLEMIEDENQRNIVANFLNKNSTGKKIKLYKEVPFDFTIAC
jgi:predicted transcriptional regulator YheO